jgi:hypothetical protein
MIKIANNLKALAKTRTNPQPAPNATPNISGLPDPSYFRGIFNRPKNLGNTITPKAPSPAPEPAMSQQDFAAQAMGARNPSQHMHMDPANLKARTAMREQRDPNLVKLRNSAPHPGLFGHMWMSPERMMQFEKEQIAASQKAKSLFPQQ